MAKKAKRYETVFESRKDEDYGLLPGLEHVNYINKETFKKEQESAGTGFATFRGEKKLHKALIR